MSLNNNNKKKQCQFLNKSFLPNELMADRSYERGTIFLQLALALRSVPPLVQTTAAKSPAKLRKLMSSHTLTSCRYDGGDS